MNIEEKEIARRLFQSIVRASEGDAFEKLFSDIMRIKNPNFRQVKPNGREGDRKNDGFDPDSGVYYQVYAPQDVIVSEKNTIKKLEEDFIKLLEYWPKNGFEVKEFYYVVNDKYKGLPPAVHSKIEELKNNNPSIKIDKFDAQDLENIFIDFSDDDMIKIIDIMPHVNNSKTKYEIYHYVDGKFPIFDLMQQKYNSFSEIEKEQKEQEAILIKLADYLLSKLYTQQIVAKKVNPGLDIKDLNFTMLVEKAIFDLAGKPLLEQKSITELFMLIVASHFYNCGLILTEWECNLFNLADSLSREEMPHNIKEASDFINRNKQKIYGEFNQLQSNNLFVPKDENQLKKQLSEILVSYLDFKQIQIKTRNKDDNNTDNGTLRKDYLYNRQLKRTEQHILNLESVFTEKLGTSWPKNMIRDLASVCVSWKNDYATLTKMDSETVYFSGDEVDLQFVAGIVRLSISMRPDIYLLIKEKTGLGESIKNHKIIVSGCCEKPSDYYQVKNYLDYVEEEIKNLNFISEKLKKEANPMRFELNRKKMKYNETVFEPRDGIKFSLDQNRILNLLMGSNLYSDEWVCLRELYQNSLDACRCVIAQDDNYIGKIEFGIEESDGEKYLYCKDNGIGMNRNIIENYLLKVGNSYYQSEDFIRKQSKWKSHYKPVSQFGIGILSCFMIGNRIEIVSRLSGQSEYVSCCIEGLQEHFYYKKDTDSDTKKSIGEKGTIVKIQLKPEKNINNNIIDKIGVVLINEARGLDEYSKKVYSDILHVWNHHLFHHLDKYITRIPKNIKVHVRLKDQSSVPIRNKPFYFHIDETFIQDNDEIDIKDYKQKGLKEYEISCTYEGLEFHSIIALPLANDDFISRINLDYIRRFIVKPSPLSFDGISVEMINFSRMEKDQIDLKSYDKLARLGALNFVGENKPQLSVDRQRIIRGWASKETLLNLFSKIIEQIINTTNNHISQLGTNKQKVENIIWQLINDYIEEVSFLVPSCIVNCTLTDFSLPVLSTILSRNISVQDFLETRHITIPNYNFGNINILNRLVHTILMMKLATSERADISEDGLDIHFSDPINYPNIFKRVINIKGDIFYSKIDLVIPIMKVTGVFKDYDIVTSLLPFVSERMSELLVNKYQRKKEQIADSVFCEKIIKIEKILRLLSSAVDHSIVEISPQNPFYTAQFKLIPDSNNKEIATCLFSKRNNGEIIPNEYSVIFVDNGSLIFPGRYNRKELETILQNYKNKSKMKPNKKEEVLKAALEPYQRMAMTNPDAYCNKDVAQTLNNLALIHRDHNQYEDAEKEYNEALKIYRELDKKNPGSYKGNVAKILYNISKLLLKDEKRRDEARKACEEALQINQNLAIASPQMWNRYVDKTQQLLDEINQSPL